MFLKYFGYIFFSVITLTNPILETEQGGEEYHLLCSTIQLNPLCLLETYIHLSSLPFLGPAEVHSCFLAVSGVMTGSGQTYVVVQEGDNISFVPAEMVQGDLGAVNGGQVSLCSKLCMETHETIATNCTL